MPNRAPATDASQDDAPPILGTWRNVYAVVLSHLAVWIVLLYLFTARYLPHVP